MPKDGNSSKSTEVPETAECVIARHRHAEDNRNQHIKESRDQKAKLARAAGISMTGWEKY
jgi:hypothetical protein